MSTSINTTLQVQIEGTGTITVQQSFLVEACDTINVTIATGGAAQNVEVQPGAAGQVQFALIMADAYPVAGGTPQLTYEVDGGGVSRDLDAPLLLQGVSAVSAVGALNAIEFTNNSPEDVNVTILVGRDAYNLSYRYDASNIIPKYTDNMPIAPTYPGVYIEEVPSDVRTITGVATSITAFIGRALSGPVDEPVFIQSFAEYARRFGGLWSESMMSYAVQHYFTNGGRDALIVRVDNGVAAIYDVPTTGSSWVLTASESG